MSCLWIFGEALTTWKRGCRTGKMRQTVPLVVHEKVNAMLILWFVKTPYFNYGLCIAEEE